ncbi:MAG TPA: SRPBCC family protein [Actinomycetota bacterium]|jgi:uncharacterized protein YndB with AHSA1/START domain|nr:SRPBCC family protein [Actinomycetota bacterium]
MAAVTSSRSAVLTLPTDTQILVTREFAAPKHLVFKAYTTPELIRRWWTAKRGTMRVCDVDLRVGGAWRFVMDADDGQVVAFHGTYTEIVADERLVSTETFEGAFPPGHEYVPDDYTLNTLTLTETDGRTTMTLLTETKTKEVRDMIIQTGMEDGLQDALDLLEETAVSLR